MFVHRLDLFRGGILSSHNTATIAADLRKSIGLDKTNRKPKELNKRRMEFDESSVKNCKDVIGKYYLPLQYDTFERCHHWIRD